MIEIILIAIAAYLIGSIMPSIILTKKFKGYDIREKGSNNAGSTNVFRNEGIKLGLATFLLDFVKGILAVSLVIVLNTLIKFQTNISILAMIATIFVILGHTYPVFFKFKGGKGVATAIGALLIINPAIVGILVMYAGLQILLTKMVSVASISSAVLLPILMLYMQDNTNTTLKGNYTHYLIFSFILTLIIVFNHRSNIKRLRNGEENTFLAKTVDTKITEKEEIIEENK